MVDNQAATRRRAHEGTSAVRLFVERVDLSVDVGDTHHPSSCFPR